MPRPKKAPEGLPFFLADVGSKVKATLQMSGPVESQLRTYLTWASKASGLDYQEVELRFIDRIVSDAIRRDSHFKEATKGPRAE